MECICTRFAGYRLGLESMSALGSVTGGSWSIGTVRAERKKTKGK